jgi:hypothetical protein
MAARVRENNTSLSVENEIAAELQQIAPRKRTQELRAATHRRDVPGQDAGPEERHPGRTPQLKPPIRLAGLINVNGEGLRIFVQKSRRFRHGNEGNHNHPTAERFDFRQMSLHLDQVRSTRHSGQVPQKDEHDRRSAKRAKRDRLTGQCGERALGCELTGLDHGIISVCGPAN